MHLARRVINVCIFVLTSLLMHTAWAQGQIRFSTRVLLTVVDAPIYREDGVTGAGEGFVAQLFFVDHDGVLKPLLPATTFQASPPGRSMYVYAIGSVEVPGFEPGNEVTFRLRAWEGVIQSGELFGTPVPSWEQATRRNESTDIQRVVGGGSFPAASLLGLQGFTIPEPSTWSLIGTAAAVLLVVGGRWKGRARDEARRQSKAGG